MRHFYANSMKNGLNTLASWKRGTYYSSIFLAEDGCKKFFWSGTKGVCTSSLRFIETIDGVGMAPQTPRTTH